MPAVPLGLGEVRGKLCASASVLRGGAGPLGVAIREVSGPTVNIVMQRQKKVINSGGVGSGEWDWKLRVRAAVMEMRTGCCWGERGMGSIP